MAEEIEEINIKAEVNKDTNTEERNIQECKARLKEK
jgi:hypothetical protein